jgi:phosphopantothenoylcysteine decarboxylase/phosphopantothenate--cysteine ligase
VSGGIAAYKAAELVRRLRAVGADVRVVMTEAATRFVAPLTFQSLSGHPVASDLWAPPGEGVVEQHVALAEWGEYCVVAPATADLVGKLACGLADDALTATLLAFSGGVLVVPAMNRFMWSHPAVQANVQRLGALGYRVMPPRFGALANGSVGWGRMPEPEEIVAELERLVASAPPRRAELPPPGAPLGGLAVLVTAGPTREPLDPVRYISNPSSGKMGWALAEAARDRGARVTLVSGPVSLPDPAGVRVVRVETAEEMGRAAMEAYREARVVLAAAAVSDWRPAEVSPVKRKKEEAGETWTLRLVRTPDILEAMGRDKGDRVLVGFAAEAGAGVEAARRKLRAKNLDLVVFNDVTRDGAGFQSDTNEVVLVDAEGQQVLPRASKRQVAEWILDRVAALLARTAPAAESR